MQRSVDEEMEKIAEKLNHLSIRRQQLHDRYTILTMLRDFRRQTGQGIKDTKEEEELETIEKELDILSVKKKDLLERQDRLNLKQHKTGLSNDIHSPQSMKTLKGNPSLEICYIECPPDIPAPKVIMDVTELPPYPAKTQCPHCHAFVTTEVTRTVGPVVWLVCAMSTLIGCVAGCCLIPFCIDHFKDMKHNCPKCRSSLYTVKKL